MILINIYSMKQPIVLRNKCYKEKQKTKRPKLIKYWKKNNI